MIVSTKTNIKNNTKLKMKMITATINNDSCQSKTIEIYLSANLVVNKAGISLLNGILCHLKFVLLKGGVVVSALDVFC